MSESRQPRLLDDPYLEPFRDELQGRAAHVAAVERRVLAGCASLADAAAGHEFYGLHREADGSWVFREWAPNADAIALVGDFSAWEWSADYQLERINDNGDWEGRFPEGALRHHDLFRMRVSWPGGSGDRLPAYARRVVQDEQTKIFNAQVWEPDAPFEWRHPSPPAPDGLLIYEAHVGMAQEDPKVGSYLEFVEHEQ